MHVPVAEYGEAYNKLGHDCRLKYGHNWLAKVIFGVAGYI